MPYPKQVVNLVYLLLSEKPSQLPIILKWIFVYGERNLVVMSTEYGRPGM